jgi:hypothetical protein
MADPNFAFVVIAERKTGIVIEEGWATRDPPRAHVSLAKHLGDELSG